MDEWNRCTARGGGGLVTCSGGWGVGGQCIRLLLLKVTSGNSDLCVEPEGPLNVELGILCSMDGLNLE